MFRFSSGERHVEHFHSEACQKKSNRNASSLANRKIVDSLQDSKMALNCFCLKRQPGVDTRTVDWLGFVAESTLRGLK